MDFNIEKLKEKNQIAVKVTFALNAGREGKKECTVQKAAQLATSMGHKIKAYVSGTLANNYNPRKLTETFVFDVESAAKKKDTLLVQDVAVYLTAPSGSGPGSFSGGSADSGSVENVPETTKKKSKNRKVAK